MKKISKRIIIAIMTCLMLFVCISCDNEAKKYEKMRAELETVVSSVPIKTTEDLSFPKKVGDYEVTWTSSNEKVISNEGVVTRQDEDVTVKITIKITNGELSVIEEVTIVVPKKEQIEEKPILSFEKVQYEVKVDEKITLNPTIKNAKGNEKVVYEYDNEYLSCENNTFTALKEGEVVIRAFLEGTSEKIEIKVTISPKDTSKPEVKTIAEVLNSEDGSYIVEGTIIATYARGFLIDDTTGKILVFLGQEFDGSIKVGDTVKVQGSTSLYGLMKQFGLDTTVEKTGEGAVDQPTATEIDGAKLDEFADLTEAQVQYVKMTGKLTVSGNYFNLEVSGASKVTGSITYPQDQEALNALAGKNIEVTGYFIGVTGSSKKYANIMVTEFKEVGGSVIEPEPEAKTIAEILAADLGEYTTEGTVVAVNAKGILIQDETGYIYAFIGQEPTVKAGDTVKVKGTTSEFALAKQFGSGIEVTKTGEGTVTHPVAKELDGAKLDEYANATEAKVEYITFTGTLAAPDRYYNVTVEGASKVIGSITYPLNADEIKALNGKTVTVTGYLTGIASSNKYANVIAVEVKEVGGSVIEPEPEAKTIAEILAADLGEYTTEGTVVAVNAKGILIQDETGYIYAFIGQEPTVKAGDTVKVKGTTSEFALAKQFGSGIEVTKTGEGTVTHPVAKELDGAKLDEYANATEAKVEYITFTGTLAAPDRYYNVTVEGASKVIGSITYPLNADEIKALNGKTVTVTGYLTGIASSNKYANVIAVEVKEVGGSVIEPEPEPITGDVVLDFVKNFGTYAGSWSTSYEPKTITGKDLGLNNNIKVVISIANKQKDDQPIADRPVIAVGKKGIEQTVVVSGFEGKLKDVTFNLKQWNEKKKFDSIIIEYSEDGTTWTKASDDAISGGSSAIATNQEVKSNVDLSTAKYIRLYIKADSSSNQQLGLTSISLNFEE